MFGVFKFWSHINVLETIGTTKKLKETKTFGQNSEETCNNSSIKRLDGVYIIVAKTADLVFQISHQISNDVHFFSFLSHFTTRKEHFESL